MRATARSNIYASIQVRNLCETVVTVSARRLFVSMTLRKADISSRNTKMRSTGQSFRHAVVSIMLYEVDALSIRDEVSKRFHVSSNLISALLSSLNAARWSSALREDPLHKNGARVLARDKGIHLLYITNTSDE